MVYFFLYEGTFGLSPVWGSNEICLENVLLSIEYTKELENLGKA